MSETLFLIVELDMYGALILQVEMRNLVGTHNNIVLHRIFLLEQSPVFITRVVATLSVKLQGKQSRVNFASLFFFT
jgi:hypothetical protein